MIYISFDRELNFALNDMHIIGDDFQHSRLGFIFYTFLGKGQQKGIRGTVTMTIQLIPKR